MVHLIVAEPIDEARSTLRLFQDAIRADVHTRVDSVMGRLEVEIEDLHGQPELEDALQRALADVADAMAEGIVAQLREVRRMQAEG